jgi:hypothetical protein
LSDDKVRESKGTGKVLPKRGHVGREGAYWYSFTVSLTSALGGGGWSMPHPSHFTHHQERDVVCNVYEVGCASGPVWMGVENLTPTGI